MSCQSGWLLKIRKSFGEYGSIDYPNSTKSGPILDKNYVAMTTSLDYQLRGSIDESFEFESNYGVDLEFEVKVPISIKIDTDTIPRGNSKKTVRSSQLSL
jgi:hypothetical protein